ncbi:unnamed protein product [Ilex paraguariensis]|uniref:Ionotropic glutamate receptor C-terminal domain-containing protein n=1 Tax=Ilex paraguariensis TaxID=185542 RepID=A0ABC8UM28_9AQUA
MLTVQKLQPTITDVKELIQKEDYVGYRRGSLVLKPLMQMGFEESNLKEYDSPEMCDELLSNGLVAAVFDEIPYMKLFVAKYCTKYIMVAPTYKTDGFGFVFPIGSPLVHDVSRAVLNVTDGDKIVAIEERWFSKNPNCSDSSSASDSLGLDSFWGLFLIVGVISLSALLVFMAMFVYENWHLLRSCDPNASLWERIAVMARHFNKKDSRFYTSRSSELQDRIGVHGLDCVGAGEASPNSNCMRSSSSFSLQASPDTVFSEQGTPQNVHVFPNMHLETVREILPAIELTSANQEG